MPGEAYNLTDAAGAAPVRVVAWETDQGKRYRVIIETEPPIRTGILRESEVRGLLTLLRGAMA